MMTLFEWLIFILLSAIVISQIIIPSLFNRPIFPIFSRENRLKDELKVANQIIKEVKLEKQIKETLKNDI